MRLRERPPQAIAAAPVAPAVEPSPPAVAPEQAALEAARDAVQRLQAERVSLRHQYRAALEQAEGEALVALRTRALEVEERLCAATVARFRAELASLEAERQVAEGEMQAAREAEGEALAAQQTAQRAGLDPAAWAQRGSHRPRDRETMAPLDAAAAAVRAAQQRYVSADRQRQEFENRITATKRDLALFVEFAARRIGTKDDTPYL